ncbi:hypothetical protein BaRGS_00020152 [Batillaria attramentaria]|uniref:Uncharacterized protein n=1 Tax=Batillaria attramentaria TaxID=370345 RepID=A0ABD0KMT0_9CAEN
MKTHLQPTPHYANDSEAETDVLGASNETRLSYRECCSVILLHLMTFCPVVMWPMSLTEEPLRMRFESMNFTNNHSARVITLLNAGASRAPVCEL